MQAIEFEAQINNGTIQLPNAYNHWQLGKKVKVIVLSGDESSDTELQQQKKVTLSCLDLVQQDIGIIENAPSDLSSNPHHLEGYGK